uniref:Major facilitator superfamily (MFS) profile domain-containing protein n=1 Tax=Calcidiscus leptoporus TaxID=127549 RepID=A0A7S0JM16_9EUKA
MPAIAVPLAVWCLPARAQAAEGLGGWRHLFTRARGTTAASLAASAVVCEALNPILARQLLPLGFSIPQVGLYFAAICFSYTLAAPVCGFLVDRGQSEGRSEYSRLKLLMVYGWAMSMGAHALLGPLSLAAGAPVARSLLAVPLLGASAALLIVPSLPDMQEGLHPDDETGRATVCAAWNGIYSFGSALGPLLSSSLFASIGFCGTCTCLMAIGATAAVMLGARARNDDTSRPASNALTTTLQPDTVQVCAQHLLTHIL